MTRWIPLAASIHPAQLRRLQALWHRWTQGLKLGRASDRALRHYYVALLSDGRALETKQLTQADARVVLARLERLVRAADAEKNRAAGTAGRQGYPEQRRVRPTAAAWRALWACAQALGMDRAQLKRFILVHYPSLGLRRLSDLHTMADLNRVLWGLKAILRRGSRSRGTSTRPREKAA